MNSELALTQKLSNIGLTPGLIDKLKFAVLSPHDESNFGEIVDILSPTIMWFNDLEQDSKYSNMALQYKSLLRHFYPGQLAEIRKNVFNALYAIRLSDKRQLKIFLGVFLYISKSICIRFGIVPIFKSTTDLDFIIAKCINYLKLKNIKWLLIVKNFLVELSIQKTIVLTTIESVFTNYVNTTFLDAMADFDLEPIMIEVSKFNGRIGGHYENGGALFLNGEYLKLSEVNTYFFLFNDENYQPSMMQLYQRQLSFLQHSIYSEKIQQSDDILTIFANLPTTKYSRSIFDNVKSGFKILIIHSYD